MDFGGSSVSSTLGLKRFITTATSAQVQGGGLVLLCHPGAGAAVRERMCDPPSISKFIL